MEEINNSRGGEMHPLLKEVLDKTRAFQEARRARDQAIFNAREARAGTATTVGSYAGLSKPRVDQICRRIREASATRA